MSSAFVEAVDTGRLRVYACCGGQGPSNLTGLDELVHLRQTYHACGPLQDLIDSASQRIESLASIPHRSSFFSGQGFPLRTWLEESAASAPSSDELALSPYSFPINTLLSLIHYALTAYSLGLDPSQLRDRLLGVVGHSQGVFAAAALAHAGVGWPAFYRAAELALQLSFWVGLESHFVAPGSILSAEDVRDCLENNEGAPSCLLNVVGLDAEQLERLVQEVNSEDGSSEPVVHLSLVNRINKCVLAGSPQALRRVCLGLRRIKAAPTVDQSQIPFSHRRPVVDVQFLPVSAPYHSPLLESVEPQVMSVVKDLCLVGSDLAIPLYCHMDGKTVNLQDNATEVLSALVRSVTVERVDWPEMCHKMDGATHVLSFGPGTVGNLVLDVLEGRGTHIINLSGLSMQSELALLTPSKPLPVGKHWGNRYRPRLREAINQAEPYIETKMTRLLGTPHVMVAGMTPTTCSPDFVAAIMQAGYHAEFACGGYHHRAAMEAALRQLARSIAVHRSITCNVIYASPKSLSWQIELLRELIEQGLPIDGLTVGAGIPSPDVVEGWIELLGLSHIWFKPGSVDAIDRVLAIARRHPTVPIGLQWTGGRAGGHHSSEDFHQPILARYGRIRECENIILVAGSGFGSAQDTWPYLTGSWSRNLGFAAMPFDGILLGSRMMVAREARTSLAAKRLIVEAPGIDDDDSGTWTRSEHEAVGGVISVISEMGQPIHVLATRGMRLWHEFDRRFFSIRDPGRLQATLQRHRDEIIARLNEGYARPWFALADDGHPVEIEDLSYRQVLRRLCQLSFVSHQSRWIDPSYLDLVHDYIRLVHARFGFELHLSDHPGELQNAFDTTYGDQADEILYPDDVALLLALFRRPGQKPVPFISRLDASFETWFKKDSLWQSEDVDAVLDQDAQRVCIIQGPVAARHSKTCDDPAGHILDAIRDGHLDKLRQETIANEEDVLSCHANPDRGVSLPGIQVFQDGSLCRYCLVGPTVPSPEAIIEQLVGECAWGRAALISKSVVFGQTRTKNPVRDAFQPTVGDVIEVRYVEDCPCEITLYTASPQAGDVQKIRAALELIQLETGEISVALLTRSAQAVYSKRPALEFTTKLLGASMGQPLLQIDRRDYVNRVRRLYTELWISNAVPAPSSVGLNSEFTDEPGVITAKSVQAFLDVVGQTGPPRCRAWSTQGPVVPLDYAVVIAWTVFTKPVLLPDLDGDPLQLLHQSISLRLVQGVRPLHVGDMVRTASRITERAITANGQRIEVSAEILREGQPVVQLRTTFIIQRRPQGVSLQQFRSVDEPSMAIHVRSLVELQLLASRKWLLLDGPSSNLLGKTLVFRLNTQTVYDASGTPCSLQVSGPVTLFPDQTASRSLGLKVGQVYLEEDGHRFNPVMDFLNRYGEPLIQRHILQSPGWIGDAAIPLTAPSQSSHYAVVSHDTNPIHVCPLFARFAGRGQPVVHGMHLSATVRRILEWMVGDARRARFQGWTVSFDGIVRSSDRLRMEVRHQAMEEGLMVVNVKVLRENTGEQVMHAEAVLEQAQTAYVFTGQGTQEKGMGMALYGTHKAAQRIWDRAERHFESEYGLSLLDIVRNNPTSLTVNFCSQRGRQIRANYLAMTAGPEADRSILPGLTETSRSYSFSYPAGLLMSTQFAQPALAVMEMAEYAHLQAQGVVQSSALFAGHSLGEYSALGACSTFMPFESLLFLIFYRGLKMQHALPRDLKGRTDYAMMAVDPSRIRADFGEHDVMQLVHLISQETGLLLEVVNHNVQMRQYVCAGHIRSLWVMGHVCDDLSRSPAPISPKYTKECIGRHVSQSDSVTNATKLLRGRATIPLAGVDIPFHSQILRDHIDDYKQYLRRHLRVSDIKPDELVGRWVPNVVGRPFALDKSYIRLVQEITQSQPLQDLLQRLEGKS
ncbi:acyl transferase domain-containing protein [Aspergillus aurantiobrunneus]